MKTRLFVGIGALAAVGLAIGGHRWLTRPVGHASPPEIQIAEANGAVGAAVAARSGARAQPVARANPAHRPIGAAASTASTSSTSGPPPAAQPGVPMSPADRDEQKRVEAQFAEKIKPAVAKCFAEKVHAEAGNVTFRYAFKHTGDQFVYADGDDSLEMVSSTIPVSEDDAALDCMRHAVQGATLPATGSLFQSSESYQIFWSWYLS